MATVPRLNKPIPGESTTNPSFASPNIMTAPDVAQSQAVAGITPQSTPTVRSAPSPAVPGTPTAPANDVTAGIPGAPTGAKPSATVTSATPAAAATVPTASGAPPGVPETTPPPATVPVLAPPQALIGKNAAENDWIQAQNENKRKLYEAAMEYSGGPTSELEKNKLRATEGLRVATGNRGAAGTIESSLYGEDQGRISTAKSTADTSSYLKYQKAISDANDFLQKALVAWQRAGEAERKEIAEAKERKEATEPKYPPPIAFPQPPPPGQSYPPAQEQVGNKPTRIEGNRVYFGNGMWVTKSEYEHGIVPYESGGVKVGRR